MRLLNSFFAVASQISTNLIIRFNIEKDVKKIFVNIMRIEDQVLREDTDRNPPRIKGVFYKTPKINCYLYTYSAYKEATESVAMSQIRGKRTGMQPVYHEKNIKVR